MREYNGWMVIFFFRKLAPEQKFYSTRHHLTGNFFLKKEITKEYVEHPIIPFGSNFSEEHDCHNPCESYCALLNHQYNNPPT